LRARSDSPIPAHAGERVRTIHFAAATQPLVIDANFLRDEIIRIARSGQATFLVTAAAVGGVRLYCAPHVAREVNEHVEEWSAISHVDPDRARLAWNNTHHRLLVVVEPDAAVEFGPAEAHRLHVLATSDRRDLGDPDDVPTAQLALTLRAPLLSKDGALLRAAYGHDYPTASHRGWLEQFGALAELHVLGEMRQAAATATAFAAIGGYQLVRRNPVLALAAVAGFIAALNPQQRSALAGAAKRGLTVILGYLAELEAALADAQQLAALLPGPQDEEPDELSLRGLAASIARRPEGSSPVGDLLDLRGRAVAPAQAAARLCESPLFVHTDAGVVQLGRPLLVRDEVGGDRPAQTGGRR
jgi:predicted nucleic acid-binding protein